MSLFDDFVMRAFIAGLGVAIAAAPLGCMVAWRRMAYFGDAVAHASLLGIALSFLFEVNVTFGALAIALMMAICLSDLTQKGFASDTLLGVMAHSGLALGLVTASFLTAGQIDLMSYLLGDILAISTMDLIVIWAGAVAIIAMMVWRWKKLLLVTINPDLASAHAINPKTEDRIFLLCLALLVAVAIKIVGVLLISALLIIPPVTARNFVKTPEQMAIGAGIISLICLGGGIQFSLQFDTPTGASIICATSICFALSTCFRLLRK